MKTHYIKENGSVSSCGRVTRHGKVSTNEDEVMTYKWGTCGMRVKFCMSDAEKRESIKK